MLRVLLTTLNAKYIHTNLAIRLLYDLNAPAHPGLDWREFTIKEDRDAVARQCAEYDVVAFSCYIWNISQTLDAARRIKAINPATRILLGGPEVSYDWQAVIERPEVDYLVTGEGETPFRLFLELYPHVDVVPGLAQKRGNDVTYTPEAGIFDLKNYEYSMPYRHDDVAQLANKVLYIETSRGCPYKCEFCLASLDNKVRYLPDQHIRATLLHLMQHGRTIKFLDRTFNIKRDFTIGIFEFILEHRRPGNVFQFEITADILHPDIIRFIDEKVPKGLFRFEIGIQTVNQRANLEVSRKQNFEKTKNIIRALEHKVEMHLDLIVGLPLDEWSDIRYSFEEVFRLFAPELQLGFLKFLKGTPVRDKYEQHGFVFDPEPPYQIVESNYLSRAQLAQIERLEQALEIYWNKPRAPRTLRYVAEQYSSFDFLLALGELFGAQHDPHRHILRDVYDRLVELIERDYPNDLVLHQLAALDFCLYQQARPKPILVEEMPDQAKNALVAQLPAEQQAGRFLAFELAFDYPTWVATGRLEPMPTPLLIRYDGRSAAEVVPWASGVLA
jgi:anaerobic magnesium-protoporphyrin IX monomethyl ester cyclase